MGYDLLGGKYPYPLSYLASDGGNFSQDFTANDPTTASAIDKNWYVICVTSDQWLQIKSSMQVGAPIAYPDNYNEPLQIIWQANEYPNEIPEDSCMDLCTLIAECIENTEDLQLLISGYANGAQSTPESTVDSAIANSSVLQDNVGCDNDNLFGAMTGLTDLINNLAQDTIEALNASTNNAARVGDIIEALPVIGELPVDDILQFIESFIEDVEDRYDAEYTVALRDEYRCDLFCIAQTGCSITFAQLYAYFNSRLTTPLALTDVQSMIDWLSVAVFPSDEIVDAWHLMTVATMQLGARILGIDSVKMIAMVSSLFNDPDSDWSILCSCAGAWSHTFDFTVNDGGWTPRDAGFGDIGQYSAGVGWVTTDLQPFGTDYRRVMAIERDFVSTEITSMEVTYDFTWGSSDATTTWQNLQYLDGGVLQSQITFLNTQMITGNGQVRLMSQTDTIDKLRTYLASSNQPTAIYNGAATITKIVVTGTGTNPFL